MHNLPTLLIYSRLFAGFIVLGLSIVHSFAYSWIAVVLISFGLISDIVDGVIARRLNVSTVNLRRLDSAVDQIFWLSITAATYIQCPDFFYDHAWQLGILLGTEAMTYVVSYLKFRKEVATHAIASKFWAISVFAVLLQVVLTCHSSLLFQICFYLGMLTRLEIIAILLILKTWTNDVPSVYHAMLLRQGKPIKRNNLFNG